MAQALRLKIAGPPVPIRGRLALSIGELAAVQPVARSSIYQAIAKGDLVARKVGGRTVILIDDALAWLEGRPIVPTKAKVEDADASKPAADAADPVQNRAAAPAGGGAATAEECAGAGEGGAK